MGSIRGYMGNGWGLYGGITLLLNKGWPVLPELAFIKGPEEAGSHGLDSLACITRLGDCARRDSWWGWLASGAGPPAVAFTTITNVCCHNDSHKIDGSTQGKSCFLGN